MLARLAPLALCFALAAAGGTEFPVLRVTSGEARLGAGESARSFDRGSGSFALHEPAALECRPHSRLELAWRGAASATIEGPAALLVVPGPCLVLERVHVAEIEVRRGPLALELTGFGTLELGAGAVQLRTLPDGALELLNRGGAALELRRPDEKPLSLAPGKRVRLPAPTS